MHLLIFKSFTDMTNYKEQERSRLEQERSRLNYLFNSNTITEQEFNSRTATNKNLLNLFN